MQDALTAQSDFVMSRRLIPSVHLSNLWNRIALPPLGAEEQPGFTKYFAEQTILTLSIAMPVTALLHLFMVWLGVNLFPEQKLAIAAYHLVLAVGCTTVFLLTRNPVAAAYLPAGGVFFWLFIIICGAITLVILKQGIFLYISAIVFTLLYICGIVRATFQRALICCAAGLVLVNLAMFAAKKRDGLEYLYANSFMIYAVMIGLVLSYTVERLERSRYLLQRRLEQEKRRSDGHSAWLRQLATFLRHEVRQPIAQINSSVELCAIKSQADPNLTVHLLDATRAAQHVWHLIERASRATDAEAYVRKSHPEEVDLRQLVAALVDGFRNTHSGVSFEHVGSATPQVYADPALLKEAIGNLLSNAASFADEETTVAVAVEATNGKAEVKVRNEGPLIEGDAEALFQPFTSSRSDGSDNHHGLGLYLVRLIAHRHGGKATIANSADGKGVEASLLLPLAA